MKAVLTIVLLFAIFNTVEAWAARPETVQTVASVDLQKYVGKWYEVANIPHWFQKQCVGNTTAEYALAANDLISVVNSCDTLASGR